MCFYYYIINNIILHNYYNNIFIYGSIIIRPLIFCVFSNYDYLGDDIDNKILTNRKKPN